MEQADIEWTYGPGFRIIATTHGEFAIPPGIKLDLARALIENDSMAHHWMVHDNDPTKCPDGCDEHGDPARVDLYRKIERVSTLTDKERNPFTTHDDIM